MTQRKTRAASILRKLRKRYGDADCALHHRNAFELVIATILSAQSTDVNVNKVTPVLFAHYPTAAELARADASEVEEIVRSTGFFRQKAKNIIACSRMLVEQFAGEVPQTIAELTTLPGVARKTANVVLGTWFGKNEGVVVDTHVGRIAGRLDLSWSGKNSKDAVKIEHDLMQVLPRKGWTFFSHAVIWLGREICSARKPKCDECPLAADCPSAGAVATR
ncbi:MAG: endonuclease III [Planctomycetota bacterium]